MKVAILLCGHIRTWEKCRENFLDTFSTKTCDVFVHTYSRRYGYHPHIAGLTNISEIENTGELDGEENLFDFPNFRKVVFENQEAVEQEVHDIEDYPVNLDIYCQHRKIVLCNQLRKDFGEYDLVIRTRMDQKYLYPFVLPEKPESGVVYIPPNIHTLTPSDTCFMAEPETFDRLLTSLHRKYPEKVIDPHKWLELCLRDFEWRNLPSKVSVVRFE